MMNMVEFRRFSVEAKQPKKEGQETTQKSIRLIPTRHSRHHAPPTAPVDILDNATEKIVNSIPGTLFAYKSDFMKLSKQEEYEIGLSASHYHQEHVEYLLRGYSSLLQSSIVRLQLPKSPSHPMNKYGTIDNSSNATTLKEEEIVDKMIQLVERIEHEARVYVQLRSKLRSQLANLNPGNDDESKKPDSNSNKSNEGIRTDKSEEMVVDDENDDDDENNANDDATEESKLGWQMTQIQTNYGAPPGPSSAMYDLTLDAIANIISKTSDPITYLNKARTLFQSALSRNELDQKQNFDTVNVHSIPTSLTFNALIRISSNVGAKTSNTMSSEEEIRDVAITSAFMGFDAAHHHNVVQRNSATYDYLIQTVNAFFPDCESKGYILVALWDKCTLKEGVLDENILNSLLQVNSKDCGDKFHGWLTKDVRDIYNPEEKNGYGFPLKYSKNKNLRKFDKRLEVY